MINSGLYIDSIIQNLTVLRQEIISKASLGFTDLNKHCEDFIKEIFNRIYGYNLKNLNQRNTNYPGLDLGDEATGVAYQITSTKTSDKIDETLQQCVSKMHYQKYPKIYVFILTSKQSSYTINTVTTPHFEFDWKVNVKDFDDVYRDILALDVDRRRQLSEYIQKEFSYYWTLINSDGNSSPIPSSSDEKKPTTVPLIEPTVSLIHCRMKHHALWTIEIKIGAKLSTPSLYSALTQNQIRRDAVVLPHILSPQFQHIANSTQVRFVMPLRSYGIANLFSEQHLLIEKNVITYEFAEYHDQDILLTNLDAPLATLIFLLLAIERAKLLVNGNEIDIYLSAESTTRALIHSNYSPFNFGNVMETYEMENNGFIRSETLQLLTNDSLYDLAQTIYHAFVCKSPNFGSPFLTVDRNDFYTKITQIRRDENII